MRCPKCNHEMSPGFLQGCSTMAFNQQLHEIPLLRQSPEDVLIVQKVYSASGFHGFICKRCGLVLFDYKHTAAHGPEERT